MKAYLLLFLILLIPTCGFGQTIISGKVIDADNKLPVAFANVTYQTGNTKKGVITDVKGKFEINEAETVKNLTAYCIGYKSRDLKIGNQDEITIYLPQDTVFLKEVLVTPASNPAIRIIRKAQENREKNNFENYAPYSYTCYFKCTVDAQLSEYATPADSAIFKKNKNIQRAALMFSESVVKCTYLNNKSENKIIATKTSGFENPFLAQTAFMGLPHAISFYRNSIPVLQVNSGKTELFFLGPLASGCLESYNYTLDETYPGENDTTFSISFYPKRNTSFNGLQGKMQITTNGYAITSIIAEPYSKTLLKTKFKQEYSLIDTRWFPFKLEAEISTAISAKKSNNISPVIQVFSQLDSVNFNIAVKPSKLKNEEVYVDNSSITNSESIIESFRKDSLNQREKNTYVLIDSLGKKKNFDRYISFIPKLYLGKFPMKYVDIGYSKIYYSNKYEGIRLGLAAYTNETLSSVVTLGGFSGWGFKDKKLKYGGEVSFNIDKYNELKLTLKYQNTLREPGVFSDVDELSVFNNYLRNYIGYRFDNIMEKRAEMGVRVLRFFKINTALSLKDVMPLYQYSTESSETQGYQSNELQIGCLFSYGEKLVSIGKERLIQELGNPIISVNYYRGFKGFIYDRIVGAADFSMFYPTIGEAKFRVEGGYISKANLPYGLLFTGEGSKNTNVFFAIKNTFQTMYPYEFLSDEYVSVFFSHSFNPLKIYPKFKPRISIVQNSGWGNIKNPSNYTIDYKIKNKYFLETGLTIDNLIRFKYFDMLYIGFGVGAYYRYGYYAMPLFTDNLAIKASWYISLK